MPYFSFVEAWSISIHRARNAGLIVLVFGFAWAASGNGELLYRMDFEDGEVGEELLVESWEESGFGLGRWHQGFGEERVWIVDGETGDGHGQMIRVSYPKGGVGPKQTGAQVPLLLDARREYFASYDLYFEEGFSWGSEREGGKLPGLASGDCCSGGETCDGSNGFTARLMWREGGKAVLYLYHMDKPDKWGEDFDLVYPDGTRVVFEPGKWYRVMERVKTNSGEDSNGEVDLWIDGKPVLSLQGYRFVTNGELVDTFYFSSFHGGSSEEWVPQRDSFIRFDRFRVGIRMDAVQ